MSEIHFGSPQMLHLLWLLPLLLGICVYRFRKKDQALKKFADSELLRRISLSVSRGRQWSKAVLVLSACLLIIAALTRPAWNPRPEKVQRNGRDIAIMLDVSRSMLAEDLKPNRLERAKLSIRDLVEQLEGDRIALLAFAGSAVVKCPLTQDYGFFRAMLDDIGAESVGRGGTLIGDALRKVMDEVFSDRLKRYKDIILITDGEDQDSFPVEAAKEIGEQGVRLIAIGLGDENEGQRIPTVNERGERTFVSHQGKEVWTRLDADTLRKMVDATPGGRYINVATGTFDLGSIYRTLVASAEKKELESQTIRRYEEKFQIFLGLGLLLLLLELLISERRNGC
jgi:Ca-activated chloride channel family protein